MLTIKPSAEPLVLTKPERAPEARTMWPEYDPETNTVHVLLWDQSSLYPRQNLRWHSSNPAEVIDWLKTLIAGLELIDQAEGAGGAQAGGGTAAPGPVNP
jgi:hypothetical protein